MKNGQRKLRAALYDPYLDILGGGERHVLSIFKALQEAGCEISVFWDKDLSVEIEERFGLGFNEKLHFLPNFFKKRKSFADRFHILSRFDILLYVTDGSYFSSPVPKNFVFCMVPKKELYNMNFFNRLKTVRWKFISNSDYTKNWLEKWGISSQVVYPYVEDDFIDTRANNLKKDKTILSVGRFFGHLHSKKQDILIKWFKKIDQNNNLFKEFKLILAGGLKQEDKAYSDNLKLLIGQAKNIELKQNLSFTDLLSLYRNSMFYVHMAGFGVNSKENPHLVEHLGITPLEAMASGSIVYCYNAGGAKEIITDGQNGFLFDSFDELEQKMQKVLENVNLQRSVRSVGERFVQENFSYEKFKENVKRLITNE